MTKSRIFAAFLNKQKQRYSSYKLSMLDKPGYLAQCRFCVMYDAPKTQTKLKQHKL